MIIFLFIFCSLFSSFQVHADVIKAPSPVQLTLEHAKTARQQFMGLMQRKSLPSHYGMLFSYQSPQEVALWSFNCFIDLSVLFMDANGVVNDIAFLKSYPEMMDPNRRVTSPEEMQQYPFNDAIVRFFHERRITSKHPVMYVLETLPTFCASCGIKVGDVLFWEGKKGTLLSTMDLSAHLCHLNREAEIDVVPQVPISITAYRCSNSFDVEFYSSDQQLIKKSSQSNEYLGGYRGKSPILCKQSVARIKIIPH